MKKGPNRRPQGFVLVLTLWVIVIVAIAASYFGEKVASAVELAHSARLNAQATIDMASSRAEVLYRLATTSLTVHGLGQGNTAIALDNRPYRGVGETLVRLQDTRGLINLNLTPDDRLVRFLGLLGVPPEQRSHLIDTLRDYVDADKLERLNGAEEPQYLARGLPPPTNNNLATPWEARRIVGWRDAPQLWQNGKFIDLSTTSTSPGFNPNTAPFEALATFPGMTDAMARTLIGLRSQTPLLHPGQFAVLTGIPEVQLDMQLYMLPGDTLRVTQTAGHMNWALQYSVTLTPNSDTAPWRIDYFSRVSRSPTPARVPVDVLPPRSTAAPAQSPAMRYGG